MTDSIRIPCVGAYQRDNVIWRQIDSYAEVTPQHQAQILAPLSDSLAVVASELNDTKAEMRKLEARVRELEAKAAHPLLVRDADPQPPGENAAEDALANLAALAEGGP